MLIVEIVFYLKAASRPQSTVRLLSWILGNSDAFKCLRTFRCKATFKRPKCWSETDRQDWTESAAVCARGFCFAYVLHWRLRCSDAETGNLVAHWNTESGRVGEGWRGWGIKQDITSDRSCCKPPRVEKGNAKRSAAGFITSCSKASVELYLQAGSRFTLLLKFMLISQKAVAASSDLYFFQRKQGFWSHDAKLLKNFWPQTGLSETLQPFACKQETTFVPFFRWMFRFIVTCFLGDIVYEATAGKCDIGRVRIFREDVLQIHVPPTNPHRFILRCKFCLPQPYSLRLRL